MKHFVRYIIVLLMFFLVAGCHHEELIKETVIGEGLSRISVTLDFKPMSSTLTRTKADGGAINDISNLYVLLYDYDTKELQKKWKIADGAYTVSDKDRTDKDAENNHSAEKTTKQAIFDLPEEIKFGEYYMYAVANIPDLFEKYPDKIKTIEGLKSIQLEWDSENISSNGQMIGCFTNTASSFKTTDPSVILNKEDVTLHAWLRRAASKVTVAFNGSGLKDGVSIYLKSVRIKNIPKSCYLGINNTITNKEDLIETGDSAIYSKSMNYDANYPALVTNKQPFYPRKQNGDQWIKDPDSHSENNPHSLFFYENMQGEGPDKKQQDKDKDGILDNLYQYKEKPYATYIEVDAHYVSTDPDRPNICNITYRFMLGQDILTDYDAKRNCHYKLTLHFNNYADDPDWRIDYVTRLDVTQPETVDYRGKYFVPDNISGSPVLGNNFSEDNIITVTSFMYNKDSWEDSIFVDYKIEYRDAGSTEFTETCPDWLEGLEETCQGKGIRKLKIKYKNPYTQIKINDTLSKNPEKKGIYDLATKGGSEPMNTANCYIVDSKGTYQFPLVYGNAITNGSENTDSYTYQGEVEVGSYGKYLETFKNYKNGEIKSAYISDDISTYGVHPYSASLIWQDSYNLITDIQYVSGAYGGKGGIKFSIGDIKEGNAVIALKDEKGTIIWSWHIWVTAMDLSRKITLTNAGNRNFEIMPVNLGWCSGDVPIRYYDRHECEVRFTQYISSDGEEGLSKTVKIIQEPHIALPRGNNPYFQWGRKDPFIAGGNANKTSKTWYDANGNAKTSAPAMMYTGDDNTRIETYKAIASLIQNPDKWQNGPRQTPGDYGNPYKPKDTVYFNLWDNSCWDGNDDIVKTIYDPCPAGYHVSSIYTFSGLTHDGNNSGTNWNPDFDLSDLVYAATEDNMMQEPDYRNGIFEFYTNKTKQISVGFPANGYRDWDDNADLLKYNEQEGQIWHAQDVPFSWAGPYNAYCLEYSRAIPHIWPANNFYATNGYSVRPSITVPLP